VRIFFTIFLEKAGEELRLLTVSRKASHIDPSYSLEVNTRIEKLAERFAFSHTKQVAVAL
jgi:hypothetical protein